MMLDRSYILNLLFEIHCTPAEVARLKKINGMLLEMTNRTYHRTADMMRALMVMKKDDLDDDFEPSVNIEQLQCCLLKWCTPILENVSFADSIIIESALVSGKGRERSCQKAAAHKNE